ncbi:hypothetical protein ACNKHS_00540 [Shigella flexneri]
MVEAAIDAVPDHQHPDTVGYTMPFEFSNIITGLYDACQISIKPLSPFTPMMISGGRRQRHRRRPRRCTQGRRRDERIGERAGNCSLEEVIMAIKVRKDIMNVHTHINHHEIWRTSQTVSQICNMPIPANKAIVGSGAFAHSSGIHRWRAEEP